MVRELLSRGSAPSGKEESRELKKLPAFILSPGPVPHMYHARQQKVYIIVQNGVNATHTAEKEKALEPLWL